MIGENERPTLQQYVDFESTPLDLKACTQFFCVKLPKANRFKKTKPNEFLFNGLMRSVVWNATVQCAATAIYELTREERKKKDLLTKCLTDRCFINDG
jgi:hypothetical protein